MSKGPNRMHADTGGNPWMREAIGGGLSGAACVMTGFPFDTVKVRLQSAPQYQYQGALNCFKTILQTEGVAKGLFRGVTPPLLGGMLETGVNYMVYCRVLSHLTQPRPQVVAAPHTPLPSKTTTDPFSKVSATGYVDKPIANESADCLAKTSTSVSSSPASSHPNAPAAPNSAQPQIPMVAAAGAAAGLTLSFILGPVELIKCRMQGPGGVSFVGPLHCLRMGISAEGPRFLTRGLLATVCREVPGNAIFFSVYEILRHHMHSGLFGSPASSDLGYMRDKNSTARTSPPSSDLEFMQDQDSIARTSVHSSDLGSMQDQDLIARASSSINSNSADSSKSSSNNKAQQNKAASSTQSSWNVSLQSVYDKISGSESASNQSATGQDRNAASGVVSTNFTATQGEAGSRSGAGAVQLSSASVIPAATSAILSGGISGTMMWACVLPVDVAKTRLQTASPGSTWDVSIRAHLKLLWKEGGIRALWSGLTPTLVRAFPANAAQWLVWEASSSYFEAADAHIYESSQVSEL